MREIVRSNRIRILLLVILGSTILLSAFAFPQAAQAWSCTRYHTVKWGENLYRIGLMYGVSWQWLYSINNLWTTLIYPGQVLCVATSYPPPSPPPVPGCSKYYVVKQGDTLSKIGQYFGVSWIWLWWINSLPNPNWIYVGQSICVAK